MFIDPLYIIMIVPAFLLSIFAQIKVKRAYGRFSKVQSARGVSGAQAADMILRAEGIADVAIEQTRGFLSDHYDPRSKVLRLSPDVFGGRSLASVGVAAHEAGHAIQHARGYAPLRLRSALVPVSTLGSNLAWPLLIIGFIFMSRTMISAGILFFSLAVLFQLVTLPVEFNGAHLCGGRGGRHPAAALFSSARGVPGRGRLAPARGGRPGGHGLDVVRV